MSEIRPTGGWPAWASGVSGGITEPTQLQKNMGWQSNTAPAAFYFNWLHALTYQWIKHLDESRVRSLLGDARDGSVILSGATYYRMSKHMQLQDLAVGPSAIFDTNGYIPFVAGVFTGLSGIVRCNGGGASNSAGIASAGPGATGPLSGGNGGFQAQISSLLNSFGGGGGRGGSGQGGGPIGFGPSCVNPSGFYNLPPAANQGFIFWQGNGLTGGYFGGGAGGGGGGPDNLGTAGGAGGAGGGVVLIPCREANFVGTFEVRGGSGSTGAGAGTSGAGGGGGGGGGWGMVPYLFKTNLTVRLDSTPGAGGPPRNGGANQSGGMTGTNGSTGATGVIEVTLG